MSNENKVQLSEKERQNNMRDRVEWNVLFKAWKVELFGSVAVEGVGRVSNSTSASVLESKDSPSDGNSCRSEYRFRNRYFLAA